MQTCPKDLEEEKTVLLLAMMLAKKVADHTPSLLRGVFRTAVNFINQNLFTYVRNLVRNVRTRLSPPPQLRVLLVSACPYAVCPQGLEPGRALCHRLLSSLLCFW